MYRWLPLIALSALLASCSGFPWSPLGEKETRNLDSVLGPQDALTEPIYQYSVTTLEEIRRDPTAYKNQYVQFDVVFARWGEVIQVPFYTPFTPETHMAFSAWAPGTHLWTEEGRRSVHPLLFIDRTHWYGAGYSHLQTYTPVRVRGRLASDYGGQPWVEVFHLSGEPAPLYTEDSLRDMIAALDQATAGSDDAVDLLAHALCEHSYPTEAELELRTALARAYVARHEYREGAHQFRLALSIAGDDPALRLEHENALRMSERQGVTEQVPATPAPQANDSGTTPGTQEPGAQAPAPANSDLELARRQVRELQEALASRQTELQNLQDALRQSQQAGAPDAGAAARVTDLEDENRRLLARIQELHSEVERLNNPPGATEPAAQAPAPDASALDARTAELEARNRQLEQQLAQAPAAPAPDADADLRRRAEEAEENLRQAGAERERLTAEIERLRADRARLTDAIAALQPLLQQREIYITEASLTVAPPTESIRTAPASTAADQHRVDELTALNQQLSAERARMAAEVERLRGDTAAAGPADLDQRLQQQEQLIRQQRAEIERLQGELDQLMQEPPSGR